MTWASGCRRSSCTWIVSAWARAPAVFGNGFPRIPAVSQSPSTIHERRKLLVSILCLRSIRVQSSLPALHSQPVRSSAFSRLWLVSTITAMKKKWKKLDALGPISFPFSLFYSLFSSLFFLIPFSLASASVSCAETIHHSRLSPLFEGVGLPLVAFRVWIKIHYLWPAKWIICSNSEPAICDVGQFREVCDHQNASSELIPMAHVKIAGAGIAT